MHTFQELIRNLNLFWEKKGCVIQQPYDLEKGAGTLNPSTFLRALGPEPYNTAYVEPSRRPTDGRYGENPNRLQHYFQYQVILKPSPPDIQAVYLESLQAIGLDLSKHDIRFVHDDWENPTIGAAGLGWEAWIDGMEVTQITYFQVLGGLPVKPVSGELTYGLERLAMYLQNVNSVYDLRWNETLTYGDIYKRSEVEWSHYNFEEADLNLWHVSFESYEREAKKLVEKKLPIPAYDFVMKASHAFNILDARGAISVTERTGYIGRIRDLAKAAATAYIESRELQGFPLLKVKTERAQEKKLAEIPSPKKEREDFLLEIGSEELPATFVPIGMRSLETDITSFLKKESLSFDKVELYGTPRRLAILIKNLQTKREGSVTKKKGPPVSKLFDGASLTDAGRGFFSSYGKTPTLAEIQSGKIKGLSIESDTLFTETVTEEVSTASLLAKALPDIIGALYFPKKMRWSDLDETYARPLVWILALLGSDVIPFTFAEISSGNRSFGHRQLNPKEITVSHPSLYVESLRKSDVLVDVDERKASILKQLTAIEEELHAQAVDRERVLGEVLYLVEKPHLTYTHFNRAFLEAPKELLVSEMVEHQKYFPLEKKEGSLLETIVITANNIPSDSIRHGNNKVLSARLTDGLFLYKKDLGTTLEEMNEKLKSVVYQKALGTVWDKVLRLQQHVKALHKQLPIGDLTKALRAAELSKSDLASAAVYEFPALQGKMGRIYALKQGEDPIVAEAILEHWMPQGEKSALPHTPEGTLLSIAEKLDNLIGCFAVGLKPSSSSDPYALRRQLLGIIRMLIQGKHHLPLKEAIHTTYSHFKSAQLSPLAEVEEELMQFIASRIKTVFQDFGFSSDLIEASLSPGIDDIYDMYLRAKALDAFRKKHEEFTALFEVYKRAKGQVANHSNSRINPALLTETAEINLAKKLSEVEEPLAKALTSRDYSNAYALVASLRPELGKLFDEVKILDSNPAVKDNRLALLKNVMDRFGLLLDFSKIKAG